MRVYPDTSFILPLYRPDSLTEDATSYMARHAPLLVLTSLQMAEIRNSLRLQAARKLASPDEIFRYLALFERDITEDFFVRLELKWDLVFNNFETISRRYTMQEGHRLVDMLHVAIALSFEVAEFLTFDRRQAKLAKALGMKIPLGLKAF